MGKYCRLGRWEKRLDRWENRLGRSETTTVESRQVREERSKTHNLVREVTHQNEG